MRYKWVALSNTTLGVLMPSAKSAATITDAFPSNERGKALGINQIASLIGSLLGLVLGGILANSNWRYVFLVSVPFGVFGTIWSYSKLRELGVTQKNQKIDMFGNTTFGFSLALIFDWRELRASF
jgi:MFS family permease